MTQKINWRAIAEFIDEQAVCFAEKRPIVAHDERWLRARKNARRKFLVRRAFAEDHWALWHLPHLRDNFICILERATLRRFILATAEDKHGPVSDTDWYAVHRLQAEGLDVEQFADDGPGVEWFAEQERRNAN
jgi:hypothetical protein